MRKLFFRISAITISLTVSATDLWTGSKDVTWGAGLQIPATQFASATPGQKIVVSFAAGATDGIEFKVMNANFDHLAGSREAAWIKDAATYEQFLTKAAVDSLKLYGLELIGNHFTVTKVELLDGKELKSGYTVWTGFFWADEWSTLELYRDGYCNVDFSKIEAVRFYSEAKGSEFVINFMSKFDSEPDFFGNQTNMTDGEGYKELPLTDELRTKIATAEHWLIQFNKEALDPFNVTDVVLVYKPGEEPTDPDPTPDPDPDPDPDPTPDPDDQAVENTMVTSQAVKVFRNGQLVILKGDKTFNALGAEIK